MSLRVAPELLHRAELVDAERACEEALGVVPRASGVGGRQR
jgi:hypothetical protein